MHTIFFGVKRVHLLALKLSRALLENYPLTPARFDMMRIVHVHDVEGVGVPQGNIRLLLGVSAATVSRMLKALEKCGVIVRKRLERDARCLIVHLTPQGRRLLDIAMKTLIQSRTVDGELDEVVHPHPRRLRAFEGLLHFFRDGFDDPAPFNHPWRCGQLTVGWPPRFFLPPRF